MIPGDVELEKKFTITKTQNLLGCGRTKVKRLIQEGELGYLREGDGQTARVLIPESQIRGYLRRRGEWIPSKHDVGVTTS